MLLGEQAGRPNAYYGGIRGDKIYTRHSTSFFSLVTGAHQGLIRTINHSNNHGLFGFHPGGVNITMCDGSVHFLDEKSSPELVGALIMREDRQLVDLHSVWQY